MDTRFWVPSGRLTSGLFRIRASRPAGRATQLAVDGIIFFLEDKLMTKVNQFSEAALGFWGKCKKIEQIAYIVITTYVISSGILILCFRNLNPTISRNFVEK